VDPQHGSSRTPGTSGAPLSPRLLATAVVSVIASASAAGQQLSWRVEGHDGSERFGASVALGRDHDGDGVRDLLVGSPQATGSQEPATVRVVSGVDLATLLEVSSGSDVHEGFGEQVQDLGDVDGDGTSDFAVGAPTAEYVRVFSGVDGSQLRHWTSPQLTSELGSSLAALGDVDGDGRADVAIGAPNEASGGVKVGAVRIVSGRNGALLRRITGSVRFARLGERERLVALGDLDGDGLRDLALLDRVNVGGTEYGQLRLASSATGLDLLTVTFDVAPYDDFVPVAVGAAGDLDGDGTPDVAVGALPLDPTADPGRAFVFSGATGSELLRVDVGTDPTFVVATAAGDADGDGIEELAIAVDDRHGPSSVRVASLVVHSGSSGAQLVRMVGPLGTPIGRAFAAGADFDGDGIGDVAVGAPNNNNVVELHALPSGALLASRAGTIVLDRFDGPMAQLGDVDGDGHGDLVAVSLGDVHGGQARVVSGRDGSILASHPAPLSPNLATLSLPDVDGDAIGDFAMGAMVGGFGQVDVISTATGALLRRFNGPATSVTKFGAALAVQVQPNGSVQLAIGAPWSPSAASNGGLVEVYDLATGARVLSFAGTRANERVGSAIAPLHDVDGDGTRDWAFGAPDYDLPAKHAGRVHVVSGSSGAPLQTLVGASDEYLGSALAAIDDLDGDAVADLLVGAPGFDRGRGEVRALSGAGFGQLWARSGATRGDGFGSRLDAVADANGDGLADWLTLAAKPTRVELHSGSGDRLGRFELSDLRDYARPAWGAPASASGDAIPDLFLASDGDGETNLSLFQIDDLLLQVEPAAASAGDSVVASTRGGRAGNAVALLLAAVNGVPQSQLIELRTFDAVGEFHVIDTVPAGLSGMTWMLRSIAVGWNGAVTFSLDQELEFL